MTDISTWPAPNRVAMSALVGVTTKSSSTSSALVSSRFLAKKKAMLHRPEPWVALILVAACAAPDMSAAPKAAGNAKVALAALVVLRKPRRDWSWSFA